MIEHRKQQCNEEKNRLTSDGRRQLNLCSRQLGALFKPLDGLCNLALLQAQLSQGRYGDITIGVNLQSILAQLLGLSHVLLVLEHSEGLVDPWEDVFDARGPDGYMTHRNVSILDKRTVE